MRPRTLLALLLILASPLAVSGCPTRDGGGDDTPPGTDGGTSVETETTAATCDDGLDNDEDGHVDCDDSDCVGIGPCAASNDENTDAACADGLDNDEDGHVDCDDYDCSRNADVTVCGSENTDAACADGLDNDDDGYVDCEDYDCSRNSDVTVCDPRDEKTEAACSNDQDDDGDGATDCEDPDCDAFCGTCEDACDPEGATSCGNGDLQTCVTGPEGCLVWGTPSPCPSGTCADATTCSVCVHACETLGEIRDVGEDTQQCQADEQGCRDWVTGRLPMPGYIEGTTARRDFHAEEDPDLSPPFGYGIPRFPGSVAGQLVVPGAAEVPLDTGEEGHRSLLLSGDHGGALEICAEAPAGRVKLWVYRTDDRRDANCDGFICNEPYELDEQAMTTAAGDEVCTRGRLDGGAPYYVVVLTDPVDTPTTVRIESITLLDAPHTVEAMFAPCDGTPLVPADFAVFDLSENETLDTNIGSYQTDGRQRTCTRFRGCTSFSAYDASEVSFNGTCDGCQPPEWSDPAATGTVHPRLSLFGDYGMALYPSGSSINPMQNHLVCDLDDMRWCSVYGDWTNWAEIPEGSLSFISDSQMTRTCFRTVGEAHRNEFDEGRFGESESSDSTYKAYEVVFRSDLTFP